MSEKRRKARPPRRPRKTVERGIFTETDAEGRLRYGLSYAAHYSDGSVRNKRELLPPDVRTLGAARKARAAVLTDVSRGALVHQAVKAPTFAAFAADYVAARAPEIPASIDRVRGAIKAACAVFGAVPIDKVAPLHVERFKTQRLATRAPATAHQDVAILHRLFRDAVRVYRVRADNPCADVKVGRFQQKPRRVLSPDEERRLLEHCAAHLRPFVVVAIQSGMRLGELRRMQWADVDFAAGMVTLRETKSRRAETVPLNAEARAVLLELRGPGRIGPVFTYKGRPLGNPRLGLQAAARRAGIEGFTIHALRHTAATRAIRAGAAIDEVQRFLRHASVVTTMRYVHNADARNAADAVAAYSETAPQSPRGLSGRGDAGA